MAEPRPRTPPAVAQSDAFLGLAGFGPSTREKLAKLNIHRLADLVLHLPLRYEDETQRADIRTAPAGQTVVIEGDIVHVEIKPRPRRQLIGIVDDGTGRITVRFLHFYPQQQKQWQIGSRVRLIGEIKTGFFGSEMLHPRTRFHALDAPLAQTLTPVYPTTAGLGQESLKRLVHAALQHTPLVDTLPATLSQSLHLPGFSAALSYLHQPPTAVEVDALSTRHHPAWQRLKFDELLAQQLSLLSNRARRAAQPAEALPTTGTLTALLEAQLPFLLTGAQQRCISEIRHDLARNVPMQRLLQGDVGSGKTVVAALAALQAVENGAQAAFMAPTELLAEQHYQKLLGWLTPLGLSVGWISGSQKKKERTAMQAAIANGEIHVAVGTHALFQDSVQFKHLALVLVDEQHRFGVAQRLALRAKGGEDSHGLQPHMLMMSATPIPRTLAMSYFADLEVSVIDTLPPGRTPIITRVLDDQRRDALLARVSKLCAEGAQAYWVCPLIEESEALQLQTALATFEALTLQLAPLRVGLVHGRLPSAEKQAVMRAFASHTLDVLVATTVIEVGVDVPNASLMVIEHSERLGLAQLHQLRGRVGRGSRESYCMLLFQAPLGQIAQARLDLMRRSTDGFEIAREDLKLRGPGELLGRRQSGVPLLRFADLEADIGLLEAARNLAPQLLRNQPDIAAAHLERWTGSRTGLLDA